MLRNAVVKLGERAQEPRSDGHHRDQGQKLLRSSKWFGFACRASPRALPWADPPPQIRWGPGPHGAFLETAQHQNKMRLASHQVVRPGASSIGATAGRPGLPSSIVPAFEFLCITLPMPAIASGPFAAAIAILRARLRKDLRATEGPCGARWVLGDQFGGDQRRVQLNPRLLKNPLNNPRRCAVAGWAFVESAVALLAATVAGSGGATPNGTPASGIGGRITLGRASSGPSFSRASASSSAASRAGAACVVRSAGAERVGPF